MPEQTLGGIPLGLGMVMKINFLNFHVLSLEIQITIVYNLTDELDMCLWCRKSLSIFYWV